MDCKFTGTLTFIAGYMRKTHIAMFVTLYYIDLRRRPNGTRPVERLELYDVMKLMMYIPSIAEVKQLRTTI